MRIGASLALGVTWSGIARAQSGPPSPPPPLEVSVPVVSSPPAAAPAPVVESAPVPTAGPPSSPPPAPLVLYVAPPAPPVRAPSYALWLGGRLGLLAYGGGLYLDDRMTGDVETTGNFVQPGLGLQLDVGARLGRRYIPYIALELGLMGAGRRFDGVGARASTTFSGVGFRYLAGDPDTVAFVGDVSFGVRQFVLSSAGSTWKATGFEIFRLGFGVEARITRQLTVAPMITLSGGTLTQTSGYVAFAPNQNDGQAAPPFARGASIAEPDQASYYAVVVGCDVHADLFGR